MPSLLVVPCVHLQPAFDENRSALFQVLTGHLRCSSPERDIHKCDFLALLATVGGVSTVYGDSKVADGAAFRRVTHLRIACDIAEQENFVEIGHVGLITKSLRFYHFFRGFLFFLVKALVVLAINVRVESEL